MSKPVFAVVHIGKGQMEAILEDRTSRRRKVALQWFAKNRDDLPPKDWPAQAQAELDFQDSDRTKGIG